MLLSCPARVYVLQLAKRKAGWLVLVHEAQSTVAIAPVHVERNIPPSTIQYNSFYITVYYILYTKFQFWHSIFACPYLAKQALISIVGLLPARTSSSCSTWQTRESGPRLQISKHAGGTIKSQTGLFEYEATLAAGCFSSQSLMLICWKQSWGHGPARKTFHCLLRVWFNDHLVWIESISTLQFPWLVASAILIEMYVCKSACKHVLSRGISCDTQVPPLHQSHLM